MFNSEIILKTNIRSPASQLCDTVERTRATFNSQLSETSVRLTVAFPGFRGDECEHAVPELVNNYKCTARLNGWSEMNLAPGLPLYMYLKGHASVCLHCSNLYFAGSQMKLRG